MSVSLNQQSIKKQLQKIIRHAQLNTPLCPEQHVFVHNILKQHPDYMNKMGRGVEAIVVDVEYTSYNRQQGERKFKLITIDGQVNFISYTKAMQLHNTKYLVNKKLIYLGKRYLKSLIYAFRESQDKVCSKTWKLIPEGYEKVLFKDKKILATLANEFQAQLSIEQKHYLIETDAQKIHAVFRQIWLQYLKQNEPFIVHNSYK